jgi:hypothetical protein
MQILRYSTKTYPLARIVTDLFGVDALINLHHLWPRDEATGDSDTKAHAHFYEGFDSYVSGAYEDFLRGMILPMYHGDEPICVQQRPTFRVHYPGATAVREFHTDAEYHHQTGVLNYWLPLTPCSGNNSLWVESIPGLGDYMPVVAQVGEFVQFNAVQLKHGNMPNDTSFTRVSMDFRVVPASQYRDNWKVSVANATPLRLGGYFMLMDKDGGISCRTPEGF